VSLNEGRIPIKLKLRRTRLDMVLKVKTKIERQCDASFLKMVRNLQWVSSIVVVPKKGNKTRVCVDYMDLDKASPKQDFPLPHIDFLIDNTT